MNFPALRMTRAGAIPPDKWNELVRLVEGLHRVAMPGGRVRVNPGVGVTLDLPGSAGAAALSAFTPRRLNFSFTPSGDIPSAGDITDGLTAAYTAAGLAPRTGDFLASGSFSYLVWLPAACVDTPSTAGIFCVGFTAGGVAAYADQVGPTRWY